LRIVFAALELVADHGHLGIEVAPADVRVDHPVRFHGERPVEARVVCIERFEIVRAVPSRCAVRLHAALAEFGEDVAARRSALEHQVLEQVGHAGLAVIFVRRADLVGHIHGRRRVRRIRKQQYREAVGQPVFGDAFNGRTLRDARGQGRMDAGRDEQRDQERRETAQEKCRKSHEMMPRS